MVVITTLCLLAVSRQQSTPEVSIVPVPTHRVAKRIAKKAPRKPAVARTLAPASIVGFRIHYADNFADYIFRFDKDGYSDTMVHKGGTDAREVTGRFEYKRINAKQATLLLDGKDRWSLVFDSPTRMSAFLEGDERPYVFYLEIPPKA